MNVNYSNISSALRQHGNSKIAGASAEKMQSAPTSKDELAAKESTAKPSVEQALKSELKTPAQMLDSFVSLVKSANVSKPTLLNYLKSIKLSEDKNTQKDIKQIYDLIKDNPDLKKYESVLSRFLQTPSAANSDNLKAKLQDSGLFLESKLAHNSEKELKESLLSSLKELKNHAQSAQKEIPQTFAKLERIIESLSKDSFKPQDSALQDIKSVVKEIALHVEQNSKLSQSVKNIHNIIKDFASLEKSYLEVQSTQDKILNSASESKAITKPFEKFSKELDALSKSLNTAIDKIPKDELKEFLKVSSLIKDSPKNIAFLEEIMSNPKISYNQKIAYSASNASEIKLPLLQREASLIDSNLEKLNEIVKDLKEYSLSSQKHSNLKNLSDVILGKKVPTNQQMELIYKELKELDAPKSVVKQIEQLLKPQELLKSDLKSFIDVNNMAKSLKLDLPQVLKIQDLLMPVKDNLQRLLASNQQSSEQMMQSISQLKEPLDNLMQQIKGFILKSDRSVLDSYLKTNELNKSYEKLEKIIKDFTHTELLGEPHDKKKVSSRADLAQDLKATLIQLSEEVEKSVKNESTKHQLQTAAAKVIHQMDMTQVYSFLTNTTTFFIPYLWKGLEEGTFSIKKYKDESFTCEINLTLEEYGKLDLLMMLYDEKRLNISIYAQQQELSDKINANLKDLKRSLSRAGLILTNMKLYAFEEKSESKKEDFAQIDLAFGLDLKI